MMRRGRKWRLGGVQEENKQWQRHASDKPCHAPRVYHEPPVSESRRVVDCQWERGDGTGGGGGVQELTECFEATEGSVYGK